MFYKFFEKLQTHPTTTVADRSGLILYGALLGFILGGGVRSINILANSKNTIKKLIYNYNKKTFYFTGDILSSTVTEFKTFMLDVKPNEDIDVIINTNGGSFCAAQMISEIILSHEGVTNAIILDKALSAGTIIALSCSNLYMHKNAHLSPVDVQESGFFKTTQFSSVKSIIEKKSADKVEDSTFIMADQANKVRALLNEMFEKIVKPKYNDDISDKIKSELFDGEKYIHSTAFSVKKLKTIGVEVLDITDSMITRSKLYDKQICNDCC